ncbi:hypothetical protein [Lacrimispora defluvii]|uniref:Uncharacterized protein n=1 Tax=Lacrimispora defluvii TaxID=2719233 RepID=A0ABX1VS50_9FIRM|nr:hypothetical protein [Lacrimispora defluvii]NNJ31257.1 hypothetical protein [Lacrimispora defluvii]
MGIKNGWYRNVGSFLTVTAVISGFNPVIASANISSSDFSMRDKVVNLTGIMELTNNTGIVTRGEFAKISMMDKMGGICEVINHDSYYVMKIKFPVK